MADVNLSTIVGVGGLATLAPDLTWPSKAKTASVGSTQKLTAVDVSGSLQTVITASGKFNFEHLKVENLTAESITIKLTIDGEIKWNDTFTCNTTADLYNVAAGTGFIGGEDGNKVNSTFLLEMQTATDTSINVYFTLRPIK